MDAQLTEFQISDRTVPNLSACSRLISVDVPADTLYISIDDQRLLASPSDIDWLIEALTKAKKLIEGEQA